MLGAPMRDDEIKPVPAQEQGLTRRQVIATGAGIATGCVIGVGYNAGGFSGDRAQVLRPPGALLHNGDCDFLAACIRCGQCVQACPYDTLRLMDLTAGLQAGSPTFTAETNPCWLCQGHDTLKCIDVCPTTALAPIEDPRDVRIGLAVIDESICFAYHGTMCRACWHACPYPNEAIVYDEMLRPTVNAEVCTGCGLCEHGCPTETKSIVIKTFKELGKGHGGTKA